MKPFKSLLIIALLAISATTFAQDEKAKSILDEVSNKTRKYSTLTSAFTFTLEDKASGVNQKQDGLLKMKGKKYFIQLGDNEIYSDGQTRWTYNQDMNEVYVDVAASDEGGLNPSEIYTIWETGFKQYYNGESTISGKPVHVIKLVPVKPADQTFHTIMVYIDKAKAEVAKIEILGKAGDNYTYLVNSFEADKAYGDTTFAFDKTKHPGVETIDNR